MYDFYPIYFPTTDLETFYKNFNKTKFENITLLKLLNLRKMAKPLNCFYKNREDIIKQKRYFKILNSIRSNPKRFNINSEAEKFLLLMFAVDPSFEAVKIYEQYNDIKKIKNEIVKTFGVYDKNLISIEKFYIKNFLSETKKSQIQSEIDKRIYK